MWKQIDWTRYGMAIAGGTTALLAHTGLLLYVMQAVVAPVVS